MLISKALFDSDTHLQSEYTKCENVCRCITSWRDYLSVHRLSCPKVHPYILCLLYSRRSLSTSLLLKSWKIRTLYRSGSNTILGLSSPMHLESFCLVSAAKTLAVKPTRLCKCSYIVCLAIFTSIPYASYLYVLCIWYLYLFTFVDWLLSVINQLSTGPRCKWSNQTSLQPIYVERTLKVLVLFY